MNTLFDITLFDIQEIETTPTTKCKQCVYCERHRYGGSVFFYCGILKSNRTGNGKRKIKANQTSCLSFKKEK